MTEKRKIILVIDDDPDVRMLIEAALGMAGYEVRQASNGAKGLDVLKEMTPDAIITDAIMPVLDGHQFIRKLREFTGKNRIPVLMLTGQNQGGSRDAAEQPDEYLPKPFTILHLQEKIDRLTGTSRESSAH